MELLLCGVVTINSASDISMTSRCTNYITGKDEDIVYLVIERLHILLICDWLSMQEVGNLDMAMSHRNARKLWLNMLSADGSQAASKWLHSHRSIRWVIQRSICISHLLVDTKHCSRVSDSTFEAAGTTGVGSASIDDSLGTTKLLSWEGLKYLLHITLRFLLSITIDRSWCITDVIVPALSLECVQLQLIDLRGCRRITDIGVSALGHGCGQLQSIDLHGCRRITDIGVSALGRGCGQLRSIDLGGNDSITDIGVSALGHGCGQLQSINLIDCHFVTDIGISVVGRGCGQLTSFLLKGCEIITDVREPAARVRFFN
jgi:Leucine Rich repeat